MPWYQYVLLFLVAVVAGAVNAVAGGGTLLTFPALLWIGQLAQLPVVANATSTVALWPGQLSSLWGYRKEVGPSHKAIVLLAVPSFLGGLIGAILLLNTSNETFRSLVPYLILVATLLFMVQEPLARWQRRRGEEGERGRGGEGETDRNSASSGVPLSSTPPLLPSSPPPLPWAAGRWIVVMVFQLLVAIYGGYFGAGIGILMLAAFGFLGFTNIHRMNGLKNINGMCINAVAAVLFIVNGLVDWRLASLMAAGAILGGYAGADTARRIGQKNVRRIVVLIGLVLTISLFLRG
jgi:uncharacterized protein